jgi:hypothetical protein
VDVVRGVTEFTKGKGKSLIKQWWPHLARWDGVRMQRVVLCFKICVVQRVE